MSGRTRLLLLLSLLLGLLAVLVVQPTFWPRNWLWADVEPLLDSEGEAIGQVFVGEFHQCNPHGICALQSGGDGGGGTTVLLTNPLIGKFFPADFHPAADPQTGSYRRYGAALFRGDSTTPGVLAAVIAKVNPSNPEIVHQGALLTIAPEASNFFAGKAEAVLAVSEVDPSGAGNGSLALVISGTTPAHEPGLIVVVRNAWGEPELDVVAGLTGPVSVAIDDDEEEVIVVEQTEDGEGAQECTVGQSPLRFFALADADDPSKGGELRRFCIDGVGDSADMEIDSAGHRLFVARSFDQGGVTMVNLNTFEPTTFNLYDPVPGAPAPGLDLDVAVTPGGMGYLAAPELNGVLGFNLSTGAGDPLIPADVFYHAESGIATGLQEVSVANFPDGSNTVRRGIVISRSDPVNFPNRADQVTRINLNTSNTNRQDSGHQTQVISFVPQRSTDQSNQQFFLRIKVVNSGTDTRLKLKKYDAGTAP